MSTSPTRDRLVSSATLLLRSKGADGFGVAELLNHSNVARRSMYQHFPDGKAELLRVATAEAGKTISMLLKSILAEMHSLDALDVWAKQWAQMSIDSNYELGCPLAAASLAAHEYPAAGAEAAAAFTRFAELITNALVRDGLDAEEARITASVLVSGTEGAIVTARVLRSVEPFESFAAHARATVGPRLHPTSD